MCFLDSQDRPNPLQELELRVRARGFSFMACDVKILDAEEMKLVKWRTKKTEMVSKVEMEMEMLRRTHCQTWI